WSSDVCSSDLIRRAPTRQVRPPARGRRAQVGASTANRLLPARFDSRPPAGRGGASATAAAESRSTIDQLRPRAAPSPERERVAVPPNSDTGSARENKIDDVSAVLRDGVVWTTSEL